MRGRHAEREAVAHLLAQARDGHSGVLVVRGEAGIGKTSLLTHAREAASGFRVLHGVGAEAEAGFAFAGLHQLCAPVLDHLDALPDPQRNAVDVALGRRGGDRPDPFLVGLATLGLLAEAANERALLCMVDDAQWLDTVSLQVLAFVARRLHAEPVALVFGLRTSAPGSEAGTLLTDLPILDLGGLLDDDARSLLASAIHEPLDVGVRDRIVAEARGNPLALLELARHAGPTALAGGFGLPDALSVPEGIEQGFRRRTALLPAATQLALLVAAAEPLGDVVYFRHACDHLGLGVEDTEPAQSERLLEIGTRVQFTHPLARSAVYEAATPADRRRAHGAIAASIDPRADPDRHTWHEAHAVLGTDETIAAELQVAAGRARARGGPSAEASFLERSAELSPDPATRARRLVDAAYAKHRAGASESAMELLAATTRGALDDPVSARVELLRAQIAFHTVRGSDVPERLVDAARLVAPFDTALSRETTLHALEAAMLVGRFGRDGGVTEIARAARTAPESPTPPRALDLLLDGLVTYFVEGYPQCVPVLRRAIEARVDTAASADEAGLGRQWLFCHTALGLWDAAAARALAGEFVRRARERGALTTLPFALTFLGVVLVHDGELSRVAELLDESDTIAHATRSAPIPHGRLLLAAWRGDDTEVAALHRRNVDDGTRRGEGTAITIADYAMAVLHNGLGDHGAALDAAERVWGSGEMVHSGMAMPELVEAAVRVGRPERAAAAVEDLGNQARATDAPWARGLEARSRAMTSNGTYAETLFRESIEYLTQARTRAHLARTRLVYGEWLRREGRRRDAREQLRTAHDLLSEMGAKGFAARAADELRATGEQPRSRSAQPSDSLTAQELRIARLVATGATSKEVGAQLFLSPRTIDAHLRSIFPKLGITSRRQLRDLRLT